MRVLKYSDISQLIEKISYQTESINPIVSSGGSKVGVIKKGLKIRHIPSGLVYTVSEDVNEELDPVVIYCYRPGKELAIQASDFNEYERL